MSINLSRFVFGGRCCLAVSRVGSIDRSSVQGIKICFVCVCWFSSHFGTQCFTPFFTRKVDTRTNGDTHCSFAFGFQIQQIKPQTSTRFWSFSISLLCVCVYFPPSFSSPITTQTLVPEFDDKEFIIITTATVCTLCVLCGPVFVTERQPGNSTQPRSLFFAERWWIEPI